ncbi:hypothetical protein [Nitrososphaeria virus YSH_922147]|uniref:Uncharacterized protein n=1 Tax=Nitrososphaeria virus YSH_922147 TaxID=3071323 RepID=A0A976UAQ5_9CAUD|nr:hypothetical protein QKV94_gp19 [Yangshan Harbor Nitrososphaeria virus]UVF62428.1 hypothetical protein [Nitrososphaeria virus YSH_922147]
MKLKSNVGPEHLIFLLTKGMMGDPNHERKRD